MSKDDDEKSIHDTPKGEGGEEKSGGEAGEQERSYRVLRPLLRNGEALRAGELFSAPPRLVSSILRLGVIEEA